MSVSPRINRAFWWATLIDVSTCRAWLTSMGQQTAERQIGHLLCELLARLQAVGWADDNGYDLTSYAARVRRYARPVDRSHQSIASNLAQRGTGNVEGWPGYGH